MKISIQSFKGVAPRINPRYLADGMAQIARNAEAFGGSLRPLRGVSEPLTGVTLQDSVNLQAIYRFGEDLDNETKHWFAWDSDVDVCRGQVAKDESEWTFYTGDDFPKGTNNRLALDDEVNVPNPPNNWLRLGIPAPDAKLTAVADDPELDVEPAVVTIPASVIAGATTDSFIEVSTNGSNFVRYNVTSPTPAGIAALLNGTPRNLDAREEAGAVVVEFGQGETPSLTLRVGDYVEDEPVVTGVFTGTGFTEDPGTPDTRVYVYTWISKVDGLIAESPPSPASESVDVYKDAAVTLTGFGSPPAEAGYEITGLRIYRSVAGTYLLVPYDDEEDDEDGPRDHPPSPGQIVDAAKAEDLAEEIPSEDWVMPPENMRGLINLPGGVMAGFTGRDVYFCDPFRPYAWPETYNQAVDAPVVGLGRMDTTLCVLTKGNPYFMQGASPDVMTVVKSDIEQACVAKRSIVSLAGGVVYASPDGLMFLSSGGSRILTQEAYDADDWREAFNPETIRAFGYDNQYIAFYEPPGGGQAGFVYDFVTGQLVLHDLWYKAGYTDLRNDTLYVLDGQVIRKWDQGETLTATWRSKVYSMPYTTSFSCAQVQAEGYPAAPPDPEDEDAPRLIFRAFANGALLHEQMVTSRAPFRLPATPARDWEIELETDFEIFAVALAQSMGELNG